MLLKPVDTCEPRRLVCSSSIDGLLIPDNKQRDTITLPSTCDSTWLASRLRVHHGFMHGDASPLANLPTLVVPLEKTLSADVESRFKAITDPKV